MAKRRPIPLAAVDKLMRRAGAKRVSESARIRMAELVEELIARLGERAAEMAKHAKRKTIREADIKAAIREILGEAFLI